MHKHQSSKYVKQKLIKLQGEIDTSTITVGDLNTPLSTIDRTITQKIRRNIEELKKTINQQDLIDIYRILYSTVEHIFFSSTYGTYTNTDYILG